MQGVFHAVVWEYVMGTTVLGDSEIRFGWHMRGESHMGVKQFWRGDLILEHIME